MTTDRRVLIAIVCIIALLILIPLIKEAIDTAEFTSHGMGYVRTDRVHGWVHTVK